MKKLISKDEVGYSSEVVMHKGEKYKIVCSNGNSYSKLAIYVFVKDGGLSMLATEMDIPSYRHILYYSDSDVRLKMQYNNILAAEDYIKKIF